MYGSDNFQGVLEQIITIKDPFSKELGGIIDYTQGNIAHLFSFAENEEKKLTLTHIDAYITKIITAEQALASLSLENLSSEEQAIITQVLEFVKKQLQLLRHAVYIEAGTGGYELQDHEYSFHKQAMDALLEEIYGHKVSDLPEERNSVVAFLELLLEDGQRNEKLTPDEVTYVKKILVTMKEKYAIPDTQPLIAKFRESIKQPVKGTLTVFETALVSAQMLTLGGNQTLLVVPSEGGKLGIHEEEIAGTPLKQKCLYIEQRLFENSQKDELKRKIGQSVGGEEHLPEYQYVIVDPTKSTCSVAGSDGFIPNTLYQYSKNGTLESTRNVLRMLGEVFDHEVGTHMVRNAARTSGLNAIMPRYLQTEEGMAIFNERALTTGLTAIDMTPTEHHVGCFLAENFPPEDSKQLMSLLRYRTHKGQTPEKAGKSATSRVERMYRFGGSRKDVVYYRGFMQAVQKIQDLVSGDRQDEVEGRAKLAVLVKQLCAGKRSSDFIEGNTQIVDEVIAAQEDRTKEGNAPSRQRIMWGKLLMSLVYPEVVNRKDGGADPRMLIHLDKVSKDDLKKLVILSQFIKNHMKNKNPT